MLVIRRRWAADQSRPLSVALCMAHGCVLHAGCACSRKRVLLSKAVGKAFTPSPYGAHPQPLAGGDLPKRSTCFRRLPLFCCQALASNQFQKHHHLLNCFLALASSCFTSSSSSSTALRFIFSLRHFSELACWYGHAYLFAFSICFMFWVCMFRMSCCFVLERCVGLCAGCYVLYVVVCCVVCCPKCLENFIACANFKHIVLFCSL